ncbi:glycosyltransferase family 2 protein [Shewanella fidelis]|uniref:Glycosyltransferase family 2 protein n=1 Tax=Shewanella fidelis TaxID=173509 RepID=A0AAW8NRD3_9GAMM|nr:glycosyltransferase family 2 protein [Shewanella fidelis]MDR8524419.1 glycosyltransferase family 2 protein [Shewanella fidelis]MDW4811895.1 glycosyltransferase family 2 protein [Shewanella fidelis]MDW4817166.1 glycosyltransferase family 2 protein [Shewanella fidelis]MDW4821236.1 glycosyltransferase family 2 protein [Shewanella fidelis]MDW4822501.1 glycosyltransferase family 2 protein [Shewanella fidelis]
MYIDNHSLVSIILPVFNSASKVGKAIDSVLIQSVEFELIIVDDGSTDDIDNVIQSYSHERIRFFKMPANGGVAEARNFGISKAKGNFIAFIDADDVWHHKKLEFQLEQMLFNGWSLSYCTYQRVSDSGSFLNIVTPREKVSYDTMLLNNSIATSTACLKAELAKKVLFKKVGHEDYVFWMSILQLIKNGHKIKSDEPLVQYMVSSNSLSSNKFKAVIWQWHNYRENLKLPFFKSVYCFSSYIMLAILKRISG